MKFYNNKERALSIEITPLIDIVFLLVIFFVVTSKIETNQYLTLDLPESKSFASALSNNSQNIILLDDSIKNNIAFGIDEKEIDLTRINECIKSAGLDLPMILTASGGGAKSSLLQFIANISGKTISHSLLKDKTAIGVYRLLSGNNLTHAPKETSGKRFYPVSMPTIKGKIDKWKKNIKILKKT